MFSNSSQVKESSKAQKNGIVNSSTVNIIGQGTKINGEIGSDSDIRVDGVIIGNIESKAKVVVGTTGEVKGDIICQNADISGTVTGKITVKELLFLKETAQVNGSISTHKLVIDSGANFNGDCSMSSVDKASSKDDKSKKSFTLKREAI